jgi:hypothetical protein
VNDQLKDHNKRYMAFRSRGEARLTPPITVYCFIDIVFAAISIKGK